VTSLAKYRLRLAKDAIRHAKQILPHAGNQLEGLENSRYNSWLAHLVGRIDGLWDLSGLGSYRPDTDTLAAAKATYIRSGNCGEHASVVFAYLRAHAPGELLRVSKVAGYDHHFVLIGDHRDPDHEVAVADPWPTEATACLWDDHHVYNPQGLTTLKEMDADGVEGVEYVRNRIRLRGAGRTVAAWDLRKFKERGIHNIAQDLRHFGMSLPHTATAAEVCIELEHFADIDIRDIANWSDRKLNLWCASQVDPAVLSTVIVNDSSSPNVVGIGIGLAQSVGRLDWVDDQPNTAAPGREYRYSDR
jgi:hypothetical protein